MTTGKIDNLEKWIHQNKAEIIDCIEGSLLDNLIISCKKGIAFLFETYCTCWSSCYTMYFFRDSETQSTDYTEIEKEWYKLTEQ